MNISYQRALILHAQARYEDAERELQNALVEEPGDAQAQAMLAICLTQQGKFRAGRDVAELTISKEPTLAYAYYALAATLLKDAAFQSARVSEAPSSPALGRRIRLQLAESAARQAIRLHPENANYHALLANIFMEQERPQPALDAARLALAFEQEHAEALKVIAVVATSRSSTIHALSASVAAITASPEGAIENALYGAALLRAGQRSRAMQHLEEALRLDPNHRYVRKQFLEGARSRSRFYALSVKTRHKSIIVANPFAFVYSMGLTVLTGLAIVLAYFISAKMRVNDSRSLILLAGLMLPALILTTHRAWIDFRLQFDDIAGHLLTRGERLQANVIVWMGATLIAAQSIPIAGAAHHPTAGWWVFAILETGVTAFFISLNRSMRRRRPVS